MIDEFTGFWFCCRQGLRAERTKVIDSISVEKLASEHRGRLDFTEDWLLTRPAQLMSEQHDKY